MNDHARTADAAVGRPAGGGLDQARPASMFLAVAWLALVTLAVVGRAWQPAPHVTPLAAVALAAGTIFPATWMAASVPVAALVIGNLFLPAYDSLAMAAVVVAALAWPVVLGRAGLLGGAGRGTRWLAVTGGALASSLVFFFATNLAFWILFDVYPHTAAGLVACFGAALPFHRWMPVGDVAWSLAVFGALSGLAKAGEAWVTRRLVPARVVRKAETPPAA